MVKYTLARVGMFVIVAFALTPLHNLLLQLLISAVVTSIASLFLLRRWRNEVAGTLERSMTQRRVEGAAALRAGRRRRVGTPPKKNA